jgi:hypothetical protein
VITATLALPLAEKNLFLARPYRAVPIGSLMMSATRKELH